MAYIVVRTDSGQYEVVDQTTNTVTAVFDTSAQAAAFAAGNANAASAVVQAASDLGVYEVQTQATEPTPEVSNSNDIVTPEPTPTVLTTAPATVGGVYSIAQDPQNGSWYVYNTQDPNDVLAMDISEYQASQLAQEYNTNNPGTGTGYQNPVDPTINEANLGPNATYAQEQANAASYALGLARQQATVNAQRNLGDGAKSSDWRVRLSLAPSARYLYNLNDPSDGPNGIGILSPLKATNGVIFPYMPTISTNYSADYGPYDLTHSNYRGYFYKGSRVGEVTLTADFTAQDSAEADYLLAVITFFKACTKMFYGQDAQRGSPPPLVFLSGLGQYQFANNACAISNFAFSLPNDVDYIRARGKQITTGGQMMWRRSLSYTQSGFSLDSAVARLMGAAQSVGIGFGSNNAQVLLNGAMNIPPSPVNLGLTESTYVPTKMTITLTLLPMMSRQQISQQFSLQKFANGNLLKGGYW